MPRYAPILRIHSMVSSGRVARVWHLDGTMRQKRGRWTGITPRRHAAVQPCSFPCASSHRAKPEPDAMAIKALLLYSVRTTDDPTVLPCRVQGPGSPAPAPAPARARLGTAQHGGDGDLGRRRRAEKTTTSSRGTISRAPLVCSARQLPTGVQSFVPTFSAARRRWNKIPAHPPESESSATPRPPRCLPIIGQH